jgi:hypothetical protein
MKNAPIIPPRIPMQIAPGKRTKVGMTSYPLTVPNFNEEEFWAFRSPAKIAGNRDNQKLAKAHERKTFQIILNLQNVFGFDIS